MCENDAIVISDLHLGSDVCQAKLLEDFLKWIRHKEIVTKKLILNGDVFDDLNFKRLKRHHWDVLSEIRKLSDNIEIIWVEGNHDEPAEFTSHLLGITVVEDYVLESGGKKIYFHHGHRYDKFLTEHPILVWIGDTIYCFLQRIDPSFKLAIAAKQSSKHYLRNSEIIREKSIEYAFENGYNAVIVGHTHHCMECPGEISYYNSGCWTEPICHYITVKDGKIKLCEYTEELNENHKKG